MGSVIFDFDSTLVPCESLEEVLRACATLDEAQGEALAALTTAGMEGRIPFEESLRRRLDLAQPELAAVRATARALGRAPTAGAAALIERLHGAGHQVWIVSGGLLDVLEPVGAALGIPRHRIHGVRVQWDAGGRLAGVDDASGFAVSKVEGLRRLGPALSAPAIGVGDGATDLALRAAGFVQRFVAYTEFARREGVVAAADAEAADMTALGALLERWLA